MPTPDASMSDQYRGAWAEDWLTDPEDAALLSGDDRWRARRRVASALRSLGSLVVRGDLDADALVTVEDTLDRLVAQYGNCPDIGDRRDYMRSVGIVGPRNRLAMELSAVAGRSNASSLPMVLSQDEHGRLIGTIAPTVAHEGPPGFLHGGLVAALFDEFLGLAQTQLRRPPAMTGTLSVRYLKPTPLDGVLQFRIGGIRCEGRKRFINGALWSDGVQTATCDAIFIEKAGDAD